jgi:hypothetical protein
MGITGYATRPREMHGFGMPGSMRVQAQFLAGGSVLFECHLDLSHIRQYR